MPQTLAQMWKAKYPGAYDDLSDNDLDKMVRSKFPGSYDDIPSSEPTFGSRAMDAAKGFGKMIGDTAKNVVSDLPETAGRVIGNGPAALLTGKSMRGQMAAPLVEAAKNPASIPESLGIPVSNIREDIKGGNLGAGLFDTGMAALAVAGGYHGLKSAFKKTPTVAPPVTETPIVEAPVSEGQRLLGTGHAMNNAGNPALQLGPHVEAPSFIGTPSGRVAHVGDTSGIMEALNAERPSTTVDPFDQVGRTDVGSLPDKAATPVTFNERHGEPKPSSPELGMRTTPGGKAIFDLAPNSVRYGESGQFGGEQFDLAPNRTVMPPDHVPTPLEIMSNIYDEMDRKAGVPETVVKAPEHMPEVNAPDNPSAPMISRADKLKQLGLAVEPPAPRGALTQDLVGNAGKGKSLLEIQKEAAQAATEVADVKPATPQVSFKDKLVGGIKDLKDAAGVKYRSGLKFATSLPELKDAIQTWVKAGQTAPLQGEAVKLKFRDSIGHLTANDYPQYQADIAAGKYGNVRKYFDDKLQWLKSNGVMLDRKENYLPQLWDNTPDEINKVFGKTDKTGKTINTNAPFTHQSIYQNYTEGINAGLKPKLSPLELMQWYETRANKLVADRNLFNYLKGQGYIAPKGMGPQGWETISPDHIPSSWKIGENAKTGASEFGGTNWTTDPKLKRVLERFMVRDKTDGFAKIAGIESKLERSVLSSGLVPKTAINAYGIWQTGRAGLEGGVERLGTALKYMVNPAKGEAFLKGNLDKMIGWNKDGANFRLPTDPEPIFKDPSGKGRTIKEGVNKVINKQYEWFEKPLYDKMLPALKLTALEDNLAKFQAKGMDEAAARRAAVDYVGKMYGDINYDLLFRNPQFQNMLRIGLLAPGIAESNIGLAKAIPKGVYNTIKAIAGRGPSDPIHQAYTQASGRLMAAYAAANVVNMMTTGKPMWSNKPGHEFDIVIGETAEGQPRYLRPFGTAFDFFKVPVQVAMATIQDGNPLDNLMRVTTNKASLLGREGINLIKGEDMQGRVLATARDNKDKFGNVISTPQVLGNTLNDASGNSMPQWAQAITGLATGQGVEKSIMGGSELPVSYGYAPKPKKIPGVTFNKGMFKPQVR